MEFTFLESMQKLYNLMRSPVYFYVRKTFKYVNDMEMKTVTDM